ncbi:hypothetical protein [Pseudactinotalea sp. HY160]|uniref:hypothetical protein n=1 Tax=Pseudactinotalea sp. HY160 TaxID=2654490 RepID=UPI0018831F22|nr:hypothetical protein [Pseudactinotalea sp. HY160]
MATYDASLTEGEDGPQRSVVIEAPSFGAALQELTTRHVPDGWRIDDLALRPI